MSVTILGRIKFFNSLQWKIIFVYLMLVLFSLQMISVYLVQSLEQYYMSNYKKSLESQARLISAFIDPGFSEGVWPSEDSERLAVGGREFHDTEIVILDSYARVAGTSGSQAVVGRRLIRDEITRAFAGTLSDSIRHDPASGERRYYLAYPLQNDQSTVGVIYLSGSLQAVDDTLEEVKTILLTGVGVALIVSFLLGVVLTRTITLPISNVTEQANFLARGDYSRKINVQTSDEIGHLGDTFNYLADQLSLTINEISSEKSKVEAIINNMTDGVIALDGKGRLIQANPSARKLIRNLKLSVPPQNRSGFSLLRSLIGSETMRTFLKNQESLTAEISSSDPEWVMQVKVAPFRAEKGKLDGTLIVLHDITRERELTRRQEEFVADVSHELRTPLATVKSYIETLLDGAVEDPVVRGRFLNVLSRETERMVSMVKDLLVLSQIDSNRVDWQKTGLDLKVLAAEAVEQIRHKAGAENPDIRISIDPDTPPAFVDRDQIMRVFINLLNNAVKYTGPGGLITIAASPRRNHLVIVIEDNGRGIPEHELPRVFERFYRVEKTRSRDYGGSGLGLSIARKIVEAHGGNIWLESVLDQGTRACFTIPLQPEDSTATS